MRARWSGPSRCETETAWCNGYYEPAPGRGSGRQIVGSCWPATCVSKHSTVLARTAVDRAGCPVTVNVTNTAPAARPTDAYRHPLRVISPPAKESDKGPSNTQGSFSLGGRVNEEACRWVALLEAAPAARRAAARIVGNGPDADDCVSAAIEAALSADEMESPASWLVVVARRRAVDLIRSRRSEDRAWRHTKADDLAPRSTDFTEDIDDREAARWLADEARALPGPTRRVLTHLGAGSSAASIATELGMTRRAVESHILRARRHLRRAWISSITGLAAVLGAARRIVRRTSASMAAALSAPLLIAAGVGAVHPGPPSAVSPLPQVGLSLPLSAPARPSLTTRRPTPNPMRPATARRQAPTASNTVAVVHTPIANEKVTREHRPGPDDPVGSIMYCATHWQITSSHLGC